MLWCLCAILHVHIWFRSGIPASYHYFLQDTVNYWPVPTTVDTCWCPRGNDIYISVDSGGLVEAGHYASNGYILGYVTGVDNNDTGMWGLLSHEIVEAEIDPYGGNYEAADTCPWVIAPHGIPLTTYKHHTAGDNCVW